MSQAVSIARAGEKVLDVADVEQLYAAYGRRVRSLLRRLMGPCADVDDLLHDVFLVALRRQNSLARQTALAFLYSTAVRVAAAARRRARLRSALLLRWTRPTADWITPEHMAEACDAQKIVYAILEQMPEPRRVAFILDQVEGLSNEEIAQILDCSVNTVRTRVFRARRDFLVALERIRQARLAATEGEDRAPKGMP